MFYKCKQQCSWLAIYYKYLSEDMTYTNRPQKHALWVQYFVDVLLNPNVQEGGPRSHDTDVRLASVRVSCDKECSYRWIIYIFTLIFTLFEDFIRFWDKGLESVSRQVIMRRKWHLLCIWNDGREENPVWFGSHKVSIHQSVSNMHRFMYCYMI